MKIMKNILIATGTILEASINEKARKPAYVLKIDFGHKTIKLMN